MCRRILLVAALCLLGAASTLAQPRYSNQLPVREGRWDYFLQTLYTTSRDFSGDGGSELSLNDSLGWGFGFSYHLREQLQLGMVFTFRSISYDATVVDPDTGDEDRYGSNLSVNTFGLTGSWNILPSRITPYVNGSLAWMFIDTNVFAGWGYDCWWDPWWGYVCGDVPLTYNTDAAAYNLGLGGRFQVTDSFFLRAGYEYGWISKGNVDGTHLLRIEIGILN